MRGLLAVVLLAVSMQAGAQSFACGIPPIPPIGCKVGPCVCDASGNNCQYQMICR